MAKDVKKVPVRTCTTIDFNPDDKKIYVSISIYENGVASTNVLHQCFNLEVIPFDMAMRCITELLYPRVQNRM